MSGWLATAAFWLAGSRFPQTHEGLGSDPGANRIPLAFDLRELKTYNEIIEQRKEDRQGNVMPVCFVVLAHKAYTFFSNEHIMSRQYASYELVVPFQRQFREYAAVRLHTDKQLTAKIAYLGGILATHIRDAPKSLYSETIRALAEAVPVAGSGRLSILDDDSDAFNRVLVPPRNYRAAAVIQRCLTPANMLALQHAVEWNQRLEQDHFRTEEGKLWWERTRPLLEKWKDAAVVGVKPE